MTENENINQTPDLSPYIEVISERFRPASNSQEATHRLSTEEIKVTIKELNPGIEVSEAHVFAAMQLAGYQFATAPGAMSLKFQWLLVEK